MAKYNKRFLTKSYKLIIVEKITNKINSDKNSYRVNIELIDERYQSFLVSPNDFRPASTITPINKKTPSIDFILLNTNTPKNHKPINNEVTRNNRKYSNKAVQPYPLPISKRHLEDNSNERTNLREKRS